MGHLSDDMRRAALSLAFLCLLAPPQPGYSARLAGVLDEVVLNTMPLQAFNQTRRLLQTDGQVELKLCECEMAEGGPNGLSCEKEGWLISSFEREGSWLSGGGLVPLSRSVCCRPCLPDILPEDKTGLIKPGESPVAIVSIGCHPSSGHGSDSLFCEADAGSFVSGFQSAIRVSASIDAYYPVGTVQCCTPSILLSSGNAWELERCNCQYSADINCGGMDSGKLLQGFDHWRITRQGEFVPIAPAQCCEVCLSDRIHPIDSCYDVNFCSGHGVCALGRCECVDGFSGANCSVQGSTGSDGLPQWLISLIILGSCTTLSALILAVGCLLRYHHAQNADNNSNEGEPLREPLLLRLEDDDGSVGSQDTTDFGSESEDGGHVRDEADNVEPADGEQLPTEPTLGGADETGVQLGTRRVSHQVEDQEESNSTARRVESDPLLVAEIEVEAEAEDGSEASEEELQLLEKGKGAVQDEGVEGVLGAECSVCLTRPVQVVIIPCGHACMCRRCSRRLNKCPICRKEIVRRQRLFIGG